MPKPQKAVVILSLEFARNPFVTTILTMLVNAGSEGKTTEEEVLAAYTKHGTAAIVCSSYDSHGVGLWIKAPGPSNEIELFVPWQYVISIAKGEGLKEAIGFRPKLD